MGAYDSIVDESGKDDGGQWEEVEIKFTGTTKFKIPVSQAFNGDGTFFEGGGYDEIRRELERTKGNKQRARKMLKHDIENESDTFGFIDEYSDDPKITEWYINHAI